MKAGRQANWLLAWVVDAAIYSGASGQVPREFHYSVWI